MNSVYEMVSNRIIAELSQGRIPWRKPWTGVRSGAYNRVSKKPYSILNQMILKHDGEYATFKQWTDIGGRIRKGEKAEFVVFWKMMQTEEVKADGTKEEKTIPLLRYYNIFHISQVDGVEPLEQPFAEVEPIAEADRLITDYVQREKLHYTETASNEAYYRPSTDSVVVPMKEQYRNVNEFYSTTFHELTHSTGAAHRLNRLESGIDAAFGGQTYSKEELVAEIGSASIMARLGIETPTTFTNSAAYCQSWLRVLKDDTRFIVSAASKAEKAVTLIYGE